MTKKQLTPEEMMERNLRRQMQRHGAKIRERIEADRELADLQRKEEAKRIIDSMMRTPTKQFISDRDKAIMLRNAIRATVTVVGRSFDLNQPVNMTLVMSNTVLSARTNLKVVEIELSEQHMEDTSDDNVRRMVALIKGATYHEFAHCLWTKHMIADYFSIQDDQAMYHRPWNLLEDGYIEALLLQKSPVMKRYLMPLLLDVVLQINPVHQVDKSTASALPFMIVRPYVPKGIRRSMISTTLRVAQANGFDMVEVRRTISEMISISTEYKSTTTIDGRRDIIIKFYKLLEVWNNWFGFDHITGGGDIPVDRRPVGNGQEIIPAPVDTEWSDEDIDEDIEEGETEITKPSDGNGDEDSDKPSDGKSDTTPEDSDMGNDTPSKSEDEKSDDEHGEDIDKNDKPTDGGGRGADESYEGDDTNIDTEAKKEFDDAVSDAVSDYEFNNVMSEYNRQLSGGLPRWIGRK